MSTKPSEADWIASIGASEVGRNASVAIWALGREASAAIWAVGIRGKLGSGHGATRLGIKNRTIRLGIRQQVTRQAWQRTAEEQHLRRLNPIGWQHGEVWRSAVGSRDEDWLLSVGNMSSGWAMFRRSARSG